MNPPNAMTSSAQLYTTLYGENISTIKNIYSWNWSFRRGGHFYKGKGIQDTVEYRLLARANVFGPLLL